MLQRLKQSYKNENYVVEAKNKHLETKMLKIRKLCCRDEDNVAATTLF